MEFSAVNRRRPSRETPLGPGGKKGGCFRRLGQEKLSDARGMHRGMKGGGGGGDVEALI